MKRAFIDLETGGLSPTKHGICEVGIIRDDNGNVSRNSWLIKPYWMEHEFARYTKEAFEVHGIDITQLIEKGSQSQEIARALQRRLMWADEVVAHNAQFEKGFITEFLRLHKLELPEVRWKCTKKMAKFFHRESGLDVMCNHYDIDSGGHRALADATACMHIEKILSKRLEDMGVDQSQFYL